MKATALAPSNIAFLKYWGKKDEALRLPLNPSLSMNLSGAQTITTVEFDPKYTIDDIELVDGSFSDQEKEKIVKFLTMIRQQARISACARVMTKNSFPKSSGAASSASGFAALTVAGFAAAGLTLSEKELTIFARIGSGSACRSVPDGFVVWESGETSEDSYAYSLFSHTYWDLCDLLVIVDSGSKKISTTDGMTTVSSSPFLAKRLAAIPQRLEAMKAALVQKNLTILGPLIEEDCLEMHRVMQTQEPPLFYWYDATNMIMDAVSIWRKAGIAVYYTIDAGPNVHLICEGKDQEKVQTELKKLKGIEQIIVNHVAAGTKIIKKHLF